MNHSLQPSVLRVAALGTEAVLAVTDAELTETAANVMRVELDAVDLACSRFRPDSELAALHDRAGTWVEVGPLLFDALETAVRVAQWTGGAVDPTVGSALSRMGYDRDFAAVESNGTPTPPPQPAPGWWVVDLDAARRRVRIPAGVRLDLGSSGKALAADRIARSVAQLDTGNVVAIGGDVSMAGPAPRRGWSIGVAADCARSEDVEEVVSMTVGGLASSSTDTRSWRRGGRRVHHIVDPRTGDCALAVWRLVSVAGASCVEANAASTAAVVWGDEAPERLEAWGLAARLVRHDGLVVATGRWPSSGRNPQGPPIAAAASLIA